jgi:hypothetical protein
MIPYRPPILGARNILCRECACPLPCSDFFPQLIGAGNPNIDTSNRDKKKVRLSTDLHANISALPSCIPFFLVPCLDTHSPYWSTEVEIY